MMVVDFGRNEGNVVVQQMGAQTTVVKDEVVELKADKRQPLWDELDSKGIEYKKNMSMSKLESLLE